jgi:hypothetical protein
MTPRLSVRAAARSLYAEAIDAQDARSGPRASPLAAPVPPAAADGAVPAQPMPPAQAGLPPPVRASAAAPSVIPPDLMREVRRLYEDGIVPVREIARGAGVSERTLYKYARKYGWTPRYAWMPDGSRPPGRAGRRRCGDERGHAQRYAAVRGAGGRFVRREEIGQPFAHGIKALDAAARASAAKACAAAARKAEHARLQAEAEAAAKAVRKGVTHMNRSLAEIQRHQEAWKGRRPTEAAEDDARMLAEAARLAIGLVGDMRRHAEMTNEALRRFEAENASGPALAHAEQVRQPER